MSTFNTIRKNILSDIKVELADEFDRNFERRGFFSQKWKERKGTNIGSLLQATGTLRKSVRAQIRGNNSVAFSSAVPYADVHNTGGTITQNVRAHQRKKDNKAYLVRAHSRTITMPQRKFIGASPEVEKAVKGIIQENMKMLETSLLNNLKKGKS